MMELPEAVCVARQITETFKGKEIAECVRGNSPHKFAFYNREPEEYAAILKGKTVGDAWDCGRALLVSAQPGYVLMLGEGGYRILYHESEKTVPKKHHFLLGFTDSTYLSVSIQGWGAAMLLEEAEVTTHPWLSGKGPSPLSDEFSLDHFLGLFGDVTPTDSRFVKQFMITKPGVLGVGNGVLQDILFNAGIHPRRRVRDLTDGEKRALYDAIKSTIREMTSLDGRDSEFDLFGRPGRYQRVLHSQAVGRPCPKCGTPIEKISFLGGASYFCPACQK